MICFKCYDKGRYFTNDDLSLMNFIFHRLTESELTYPRFWNFLITKVGILDANEEGGLIYFRFDFWNSNIKKQIRRIEEENWKSSHFLKERNSLKND